MTDLLIFRRRFFRCRQGSFPCFQISLPALLRIALHLFFFHCRPLQIQRQKRFIIFRYRPDLDVAQNRILHGVFSPLRIIDLNLQLSVRYRLSYCCLRQPVLQDLLPLYHSAAFHIHGNCPGTERIEKSQCYFIFAGGKFEIIIETGFFAVVLRPLPNPPTPPGDSFSLIILLSFHIILLSVAPAPAGHRIFTVFPIRCRLIEAQVCISFRRTTTVDPIKQKIRIYQFLSLMSLPQQRNRSHTLPGAVLLLCAAVSFRPFLSPPACLFLSAACASVRRSLFPTAGQNCRQQKHPY